MNLLFKQAWLCGWQDFFIKVITQLIVYHHFSIAADNGQANKCNNVWLNYQFTVWVSYKSPSLDNWLFCLWFTFRTKESHRQRKCIVVNCNFLFLYALDAYLTRGYWQVHPVHLTPFVNVPMNNAKINFKLATVAQTNLCKVETWSKTVMNMNPYYYNSEMMKGMKFLNLLWYY